MTADAALGIDVGTSGIRAAMLSAEGEVLGLGGARMDRFGADHRAPDIWLQTLSAALAALFAKAPAERVGAVSVDGTSGTLLALDKAGAPIGPAMMYNDAVEDASIPQAIAAVAPAESAAHGAASALARAIVMQDRPGVVRIVHQADWIAEQLAGAPVAGDESNALKTGYDPIRRAWPDWLRDSPLDVNLLPAIQPAGSPTGEASGAYGVPRGAALVAGVTDGCASFLATGARDIGDGVTALGTTLTIKLLSDRPVFAPQFGIYSHRIGDMWLAGGASNSGGGVLAAIFSPDQLAALSARIDGQSASPLDYYPLPAQGERFPHSDPKMQPRMTPRPPDDADYLHGLLQGMAEIEALGYRRLAELGAPALARIRSVGGGAVNPAWAALRLGALGVPTAPVASEDAAVGVARLALAHLQGLGS